MPEVVFVDVWTPEVAPEIAAARERGALLRSIADLVLERAGSRTIGITGTAGKTTTTAFTAQLLLATGAHVVVPEPGVSANLWPDEPFLDGLGDDGLVLVELTSSHLAFCSHSPRIAVVTSFWPDHVELHGSLEAYAHAKEAIVRAQAPDDWLVVPADGTCERFVAATRARTVRFSETDGVEDGAFVRGGRLVVRWQCEEHELAAIDALPVRGELVSNVLAACTAALAAGVPPEALAAGLESLTLPPHRLVEVARVGGVPVVDDSMAGTPAKAAAALELYADGSLVLVAGGELEGAAGPVHATPQEQALLADACDLARRKARRAVLFGAAADVLSRLLPGSDSVGDIGQALERATALADGAAAILIAPMFPLAPEERASVPELARQAAAARS